MGYQPDLTSIQKTDDEIDLRQIFGALLRRKTLIAKITAASVLFAGLYAYTRKPVWEGQFEIVLASARSASSQAKLPAPKQSSFGQSDRASGINNQLGTEVEILESPSVLKPVFDFVKQKKQQRGISN